MITSLNIKNVATYDAVDGVKINDLKKVNFFFGFNGSGKSIIAKYLRNLSIDVINQRTEFNQCSNVGYDSSQHQILTFSEDFIEENFRRSTDLKGVFSLNQSNSIIDRKIKDEEAKIISFENLREKYLNRKEAIEVDKRQKSNLLLNHCWNQRTIFSTFTKIALEHPGSKENHLLKIREILQSPIEQVLTIQKLTEQYQKFYEKELEEITQKVDVRIYLEIRRLEVKLEELLQVVIVGNEDVDIAGLIQKLNSRNWVELGVKFLETTESTCPFCQKDTIDNDLKEQFNKFFDETYKRKIADIESLKSDYRQKTNSFVSNMTKIQNVFNPNNIVSNLTIDLISLFDNNIETIENKIEQANERKSLTSLSTKKIELSAIIDQIAENNKLVMEADTNKEELIKDIWNFIANNCYQEIKDYDKKQTKYTRITDLSNLLESRVKGKIDSSKSNIEVLRSQTVSTKEAVDNINLILKNAGFEGFEIDEKGRVNNISRYYLKRPHSTNTNQVFDSLSEGEKNFITFLYFYQLCLGSDDLQNIGSKKKIIVIDDPVSSLDSQTLFIVSTLIRSLIIRKADDNRPNRMSFKKNNIAQVFIFTHNFYFYKEISLERQSHCTDFWHYKISKLNNKTIITGNYNRTVYDDYSLMWNTIKELKSNIPQNSSLNIMISNTMRRVIESYVNFIGYGYESWAALLNENLNDPSYYIKCAFISTINDESHKITVLDSAYYQKIINEQPQVLFDVFSSIFKTIGKEHYEIMMDEQIPS